MKKILCAFTAFIIALSSFNFVPKSASAENSETMAALEGYSEIIKKLSDYYNNNKSNNTKSKYVNDNLDNYMDEESSSRIKYTLCDLAGDGVPEILIAAFQKNSFNYNAYGFYGFENNKVISLDDNIGERNRYYITGSNMIKQEWSSGAMDCGYTYYILDKNSAKLKLNYECFVNMDKYVYRDNVSEKIISKDEYFEKELKDKENNSLEWYPIYDPSGIYDYMSKASGRSIPGEEVQEKTDDDALLQIENCIKVLHSVFMQNDNDVCDISSFTEYDMANLMLFIGRYGDAFIGNPVDAGEQPENMPGPWKKYIKLSDMYDAAYKYFGIDIEGVFEQLSLYKAPKNAKFGWRYDGTVENVNGVECVEVGEQVDAAVFISPCIEKIYSLSDDCSYVLYKYYEDMSENGPKPYTEPLKVLREDKSMRASRGYAIIKNRVENGKKHYYIVQCGLDKKSFLLNSELNRYITTKKEASNIFIDYSNVKKFNEINQYIDYLGQILNGVQPNDSAKSAIAEYIEYAIEHCCAVKIKLSGNKLVINRESIEQAILRADEIKVMFENFLSERGISLNKKIKIIIRAEASKSALKKGMKIVFENSLSEICDNFDDVRVVLDKNNQAVYATSSQIKKLIEGNTSSIYIKQDNKSYEVLFCRKRRNSG